MAGWPSFVVLALTFQQLISLGLCSWEGEWDPDELDIFDLVEEVGENFYDIMQIDQTASQSDIRRAYRKLSLQLHPDKSDDPNAAEKFRKMVTVYDVLKEEGKRSIYDEVLEEGLPDWRQPVFYYRKMRKMGFLEVSVILLGISSVGHYLYGWANYAEQKLVLHDLHQRKMKKEQRKMRQIKALHAKQMLEAELEVKTAQVQASKPKFRNLLPFLIIRHLFLLLLAIWAYIYKKFGKKEPPSCTPSDKHDKKHVSNKKHATSKSPSAKRKNGKIRVKHLDSESSEGELEKRERENCDKKEVKSNGIERLKRRESVDGSEDEKGTTTKTAGVSVLPGKKGEKKKSNADTVTKKGDEKTPDIQSKDSQEAKRKVTEEVETLMTLDSRNEKRQEVGVDEGDDRQNGTGETGKEVDNEKNGSRKDDKGGKEGDEKGSNSEGAAARRGEIRGVTEMDEARGLEDNGVAGSSGEAETMEQRNEGNKDVHGLHEASGGNGTERSNSVPSSSGWKIAGSGRNKAQKKAAVERKDALENERSQTVTASTPPPSQDSQNESSTSQDGMWTQPQQDMLEWGLSNYPKSSKDRWLSIAKAVPGKSIEECKLRCIHLYEELKLKRTS